MTHKTNILPKLIIILILLIFSICSFAQSKASLNQCSSYFVNGFIPDGQEYKAQLDESNLVRFNATFFEGITYRVAVCGDIPDDQLYFRVFDSDKKLLFSSDKYNYPAWWDFRFESTVECYIELIAGTGGTSQTKSFKGKSVCLQIGFKK
jgi:hypothetical protein